MSPPVSAIVIPRAEKQILAIPIASPSPTTPNTIPASRLARSFAASTRERRGVKTKVGRIVPKRYSLVTSSTPASAEKTPAMLPAANTLR